MTTKDPYAAYDIGPEICQGCGKLNEAGETWTEHNPDAVNPDGSKQIDVGGPVDNVIDPATDYYRLCLGCEALLALPVTYSAKMSLRDEIEARMAYSRKPAKTPPRR
jgi:hypothetical protein